LSYRGGKDFVVESWDNDFAYTLYQYGFIGLFVTLLLYSTIAWRLLAYARQLKGPDRNLFACLAMSALVLFFMMSNVMIFARQLYYLLWTAVAVGFAIRMSESANEATEKTAEMLPVDDLALAQMPRESQPRF